jgi:integrase
MACVRKWRGRWVVDYRDLSGNRKIETLSTKSEAQDRLAEVRLQLRSRSLDPVQARTPLSEFAVRWLELKKHDLKPSTLRSYEQSLRLHIVPALGKGTLGNISRDAIRIFLSDRQAAGLSRDTVRILHATIRAMLQDAVESGIIPINVAMGLGRKGSKQAERREKPDPFTREELSLMLRKATEIAREYFPLFFLLARAGLRLGEALALQWRDVDFVGKYISVERNLVRGVIGTPKNNCTRRVDLSNQLYEMLQALRLQAEEACLQTGTAADMLPRLWVFTNAEGSPLDDSKVRKALKRVCFRAGLRHRRVHDLRHSFASLLIQDGQSLAYVKEQLGHSSIQLTVDTYGHLVPGGNRQAVDRLDDPDLEANGNIWKQLQSALTQRSPKRRKPLSHQGLMMKPPAGIEPATCCLPRK